jgi:triacylglycerol lipase
VELSAKPEPGTHSDVRVEEVRISGTGADPIRCLFFKPAARVPAGALLHIHGGGFVMGAPEMDLVRNLSLVRATGCAVLSVDYRLAPEHPHPAGLEDCGAALAWLASRGGFARLGVIGESAGGGLAAALASTARDRGLATLACQVLIYPMLVSPAHSVDATISDARTGRYIWSRASNRYCWSAFLPDGALTSANLAGLPPAFIAVGDLDLFVHDNLAYAGRLMAAGNSVEAHVYPGAVHGFDRMIDAQVSGRFTRELEGFVRRHLGG